MVHNPCHTKKENGERWPCQNEQGKCIRNYPKDYCPETFYQQGFKNLKFTLNKFQSLFLLINKFINFRQIRQVQTKRQRRHLSKRRRQVHEQKRGALQHWTFVPLRLFLINVFKI